MPIDPAAPFALNPVEAQAQKMADLQRRVATLERAALSHLGGEDWHNVGDPGQPVFQHTWANYGSGRNPVAFFKDGAGFVHIRGWCSTPSYAGTEIFVLPADYRPPFIEVQAVLYLDSAPSVGINQLVIAPDGTVSAPSSSVRSIALDNHGFRVT